MRLEITTLRKLIADAESSLDRGPHPVRARMDAETLLLHLLNKNRAWLLAHSDDGASKESEAALTKVVTRRATGEPVQYITGQAEFFGLPFAVSPGVLIPRPETEHLVETVLQLAAGFDMPSIADIGTGSGAIAVALAHSLRDASVTATDLSSEALETARRNADLNQVSGRIDFKQGDLLSPVADQRFHIIASNPPYVPLRDHDSLSVEVREFEPHSALFAGEDGLAFYRKLIPAALDLLLRGGWLVLEIGYGQQTAIAELLQLAGYVEIHFIADYQGIPRVAAACRG